MKSKGIILIILFALSLLRVSAQEQADTVYVFRFVPNKDIFYLSFSGNDRELSRLETCIKQHREAIIAGDIPLRVDGYCSSTTDEKKNLTMARTRSSRVKSELIIRTGLTEACFITQNHSGEGNYVTIRLAVPASEEQTQAARMSEEHERAEQARIAAERKAEQERLSKERAAREQAERKKQEKLAAEEAARMAEAEQTPAGRNAFAGWYAGIRGGVPFGVSTLSSFGADKTRAGWSAGIYGGYRFSAVLSLEAQAVWGQVNLSARNCCPGYWLGSDGNFYEAAVAGMTGWEWHDLKSCVFMQRYGAQLNVNLLGFFAATKGSRWTLELSPHLYAAGTTADLSSIARDAEVMAGQAKWHLGAGGNLQAGYAVTDRLHLGIYTGLTYLTGQPVSGTPENLHKANYIWESGLKLGWSFGHKRKEANK